MSDIAVAGGQASWRDAAEATSTWRPPDARRVLQLILAAIWLLDAVLQYQSFMYSKAFPQMLAGTASGNPAAIASAINWNSRLIAHHSVLINTIFATVQLLLALGIAYRPTLRIALAASIAWASACGGSARGSGWCSPQPPARSTGRPGP